ncbi:hypothetical protein GUJ93_ZPchr0458g22801 [Zizania palustris]|uniref:Uncharacterized protein n=1 Tax=Zizania palustris TaxID=103762 RepID=A0A8J5RDQ6_ZIZPA|nr:hypothetical protein GUJ93_ZPchr0458g22801 [Zizania palustris]
MAFEKMTLACGPNPMGSRRPRRPPEAGGPARASQRRLRRRSHRSRSELSGPRGRRSSTRPSPPSAPTASVLRAVGFEGERQQFSILAGLIFLSIGQPATSLLPRRI